MKRGRAARRARAASRGGPRHRRSGAARLAAVAVAALALAACTPLYVPPVPADLPPIEAETRIAAVRVERVDGVPTVLLVPREVPEPGWLQVQWFPPAGAEVASASVWLDAASIGEVVRLPFPADVARDRAGRWRAVLSMEGRILRQVEWEDAGF